MKNLLISLLFIISLSSRAQGPQSLVAIPFGASSIQGWLYLPASYESTTSAYPVVIFCHGFGELGYDPYKVLNNGIPQLISGGMRPDNITDPITKAKFSFITIATQNASWSPSTDEILATLQWLTTNYRVDASRIYINGLSAGGQQTVEAITTSPQLSHYFAAAAPMSPAPYYNPSDVQLGYAAAENIHTWFFDGDNDDPYTTQTRWLNSRFNGFLPNSSTMYFWSGGHCCWTTYENITWHDPTTGYSMWEWFLTFKKSPSLPVTFTSIYAQNGVIYWSTATEQNNDHFEIQRSDDGLNFTTVGQVKSQAPGGNSNLILNYQYQL